ncbi:WD40-repeat-containing domain protein [Dunaliella salina]|uniref:WD40-repeat-containing domain protein n=1 Tax=Dunaliella salina TaxID=3046 RepID=A0ABQ7GTJ3_DUNSA|nr:WD40-repeat-containing domain protein [Dunaliella salina]|eukprot:KAF5837921.1 WD40-repeat-containing domain protein [Dunaliella salina]
MSMLLVARLQQGGFVSPVDLAAAVDVMLKKSQGQFIWAKYAFDELSSKEGLWTPAEMEAALPSGLSGVFRHVMGVLEGALQADMPDALTLLREQLLPILVAAKSPLSPQQLAVMAGAEQKQVDLLLRLLVNMFLVRLQSGTLRVFPYHKSVLDWLVEDPQSSVDARRGHECAGKACFAAVMAARPSASLSEDKYEQGRGSKESSSRQCSGGPLLADDEGEQEEKERGGLIMGSSSSSSSHPLRCILEYALRFGVTHLCLADRCGELLEGLILDFCGLWPMAFARGWGSEPLKDLIALGPKASTVVKDVVRWLRLTSSYLSMHPRVWDLESGACKATLAGHSASVTSVALSPDARVCVSGSVDKTLRVWDLEIGACKATLDGHSDSVRAVSISPDARVCVSGSHDYKLRVWDLESGACKATLDGHRHIVNNIALSLDARLCVSGSQDRTLRVWDLQSGTCKALLDRHSSWVTSIAHSLDGRLCVSSSADKTLRVWDLESGACKATLAGHSASVRSVSISPDARVCVSGSDDTTLRKWDITTDEELACFHEYSKGGQQLRALAKSWRAGQRQTAAGDGPASKVVWAGDTQQTIHWRVAETGSSSMADSAVAYLMPPMRVQTQDGFGLERELGPFYEKTSHTASFFDESNRFICYQLLA